MLGKRAVLSASLVLALAGAATAQVTTGTITGKVVDSQGLAVPGAQVTVSGPQGDKVLVTDNEGRFHAPFLTPGTYSVRVELQGFKSVDRRDITVRLAQTVDLPITLSLGEITESVDVSGAPPVVDTRTTTVGANLDAQLLSSVPVGRRFSDTVYLAPGVSSSGSGGAANPSVAGGSALDNQYVVDGVNITNAGYGALGSYSIVFGSLGQGTPYDFIKEVQVKTAGFEAEFGQSIGGVVNVVTKSGTNQVRGSGFGYWRPDWLENAWKQYTSVNGTVNTTGTELADAGVEMGGPITKDKAFVFGAVDPSWERRTLVAPEGFPLASLGEVDRLRRIVSYAAKGTVQVRPAHRVDVSVFGDPAWGPNGPQRGNALLAQDTARFSKLDRYGGHNVAVRYDGVISRNLLLEGSVARAQNQLVEVPSIDAWLVNDRTVTPNVRSGGIGFYEKASEGVNWQYAAKATHVLSGHQVRYGVLYEDISYDSTNQRTGPTFTLPDGTTSATGAQILILADPTYGQIYRVNRANLFATKNTTQEYLSFFVQDTWQIGPKLTVRPGLRYEQQKINGLESSLKLDNNWAPRIGATFDPAGDGKSKVFANWGRFYAKIPNDLAVRALSLSGDVSRADYFDATLTQPIPNGVLAGGVVNHYILSAATPDLIDPNVKSSYLDEVLVGFERELMPSMNVGVRYVHRSIPRVLEDVGPYAVGACDILGVGCSFDYTLTNPSPSTPVLDSLGASYEKPVHVYDAVEFTVDKRFARNWSLQASYSWSRTYGTFEGFYRDDNGQSDPGITSLYDFPTSDPSYTAIGVPEFGYLGDIRYLGKLGEGRLPLDRPHHVKVFGNYAFTMGLNVGGGFTASSGKPLTALAANPNYTNGGEIPMTPRGKGFQTLDGFKTRTPFEFDVSLHADYGWKISSHQRIVVLADVFNLFNLRRTIEYDNWIEQDFGTPNPDYGAPIYSGGGAFPAWPAYQAPRQVRIGAKYEF